MNEHSFIRAVHGYLPSELFRWKIHDTYAGGVPDSFYVGPANALFVEYKYIKKLPARATTKLHTTLSKQQIMWLEKMRSFNFPAWLIIGAEDRCVIVEDNYRSPILKADFDIHAVKFKDAANSIADFCIYS